MSGSIAAFKACEVISALVRGGAEVRVAATAGALRFIGPATLEGLTGQPPLTDLWAEGRAMDHIHLTRWADYAVLCPAGANTLAKIAAGLADDAPSALALAWPRDKAFHIFPAMNTEMLNAPATQHNLAVLTERGFLVAPTGSGALACGEEGAGRLLEPEQILERFQAVPRREEPTSDRRPGPGLGRLLITAGATREPIDGVRFLSNVSTGQTGAALSDALSARGWQVTYLHGQGAAQPTQAAHRLSFQDFSDLERKLKAELDQRDYKGVIHAAAVSDYSVDNATPDIKPPASPEGLTLRLKPNAKLLPKLKMFSRDRRLRVVGFKLTLNESAELTDVRARELLGDTVDAVVANDWAQVRGDRARHPGRVITRADARAFQNLNELAAELHGLLSDREKNHDLMP
jgi:phosphopantothenoylcysteine decarboxylase/phosphopantothenate--cysteine ligase